MAVRVANITYFDEFFASGKHSEESNTNPLHENYIIEKTLGAGSFGSVVLAVDRNSKEKSGRENHSEIFAY